MKTRRYCQTVVVFSFLGTLSRTVANPLPESYEEPNYLTFFNEGDLGFSGPPVDDMGQSNTEEQLIFPDSAQPWNTFSSSELYENPGFPEEDNPLYSLEQNQDLLFASSHSHDTIIPDWNTMDTSESLEQPADRFAAFDSDPTVADSDWISMDTSKIAWGGGIKPPYCGATETPVCCYNRENWTGCTYWITSNMGHPVDSTDPKCNEANQACCGFIDEGKGYRCYKSSTRHQFDTLPDVDLDWLRVFPLIFGPILNPAGV